MSFFRQEVTKREFELLKTELDSLKRRFSQMEQEWDATVDRVAKTLRRIRRAEQAQDQAESEIVENGSKEPLTTIPTTPDRMTKIRQQLAARGKGE